MGLCESRLCGMGLLLFGLRFAVSDGKGVGVDQCLGITV
jgi:hypothetical protein